MGSASDRAARVWERLDPAERMRISERKFAELAGISTATSHGFLAPRRTGRQPPSSNGHRPGLARTIDLGRLRLVLEALPTQAHRSMLLLLLAATIARYHLGDVLRSEWAAFLALGDHGTGKSMLAAIVCRLLGLDESACIRNLPEASERSLTGRHGAGGYRSSEAQREALLCVDEWDDATEKQRKIVAQLCQGTTTPRFEETLVRRRSTPYIVTNDTRLERVSPSTVRRRVFTLDTWTLDCSPGEVDEIADRLLSGPAPLLPLGGEAPLPLEAMIPPTAELSEASGELLAKLHAATLDPSRAQPGLARCRQLIPGLLTLGMDEQRAVWEAMAHVAIVGETAGRTRSGWREAFKQAPAEVRAMVAAAPAPGGRRTRRPGGKPRAERLAMTAERGEALGALGELLGRLRALGPSGEAGRIIAALEDLQEEAARDRLEGPELAQLAGDARPWVDTARELLARAESEPEPEGDEGEEWPASTVVRVVAPRRPLTAAEETAALARLDPVALALQGPLPLAAARDLFALWRARRAPERFALPAPPPRRLHEAPRGAVGPPRPPGHMGPWEPLPDSPAYQRWAAEATEETEKGLAPGSAAGLVARRIVVAALTLGGGAGLAWAWWRVRSF